MALTLRKKMFRCKYCFAGRSTANGKLPMRTKCLRSPTGYHVWKRLE